MRQGNDVWMAHGQPVRHQPGNHPGGPARVVGPAGRLGQPVARDGPEAQSVDQATSSLAVGAGKGALAD